MTSSTDTAVEYDSENDILYVTLLPEVEIGWTKDLGDGRLVDYDSDGRVVAVEFLDASTGISLAQLPAATDVRELLRDGRCDFPVDG